MPKHFCCCFSLKTGAVLMSFLNLLEGLAQVIIAVTQFSNLEKDGDLRDTKTAVIVNTLRNICDRTNLCNETAVATKVAFQQPGFEGSVTLFTVCLLVGILSILNGLLLLIGLIQVCSKRDVLTGNVGVFRRRRGTSCGTSSRARRVSSSSRCTQESTCSLTNIFCCCSSFRSSCGTDNSRCTTSTKKSRSTTQSKLESSRSPTLETPTVMSTLCCHLKDLLTTLPSRSVDNNQCQCIFMKLLFMFFDNKLFVNLFWSPNHITVSVASRNKMHYKHLSNSGVDLQQFKIQIRQNNIERDPWPLCRGRVVRLAKTSSTCTRQRLIGNILHTINMADNRQSFVTVVTHYRCIAHIVEGLIILLWSLPFLFTSNRDESIIPGYFRAISVLYVIAELVQGALLLVGVIKVNKKINLVYLVANAIITIVKQISLFVILIYGMHPLFTYYTVAYYAFDWSTYACTVLYYRNLCKRERRQRNQEREHQPTLI